MMFALASLGQAQSNDSATEAYSFAWHAKKDLIKAREDYLSSLRTLQEAASGRQSF